jgi:hypothetical protein
MFIRADVGYDVVTGLVVGCPGVKGCPFRAASVGPTRVSI